MASAWAAGGLYQVEKGQAQSHAYCVGTDPDGDQIAEEGAPDEKYPAGAKSYDVSYIFTAGTGKYTGITGEGKSALYGNQFRPAVEGTYLDYAQSKGSYKIP